MDNNELLDFNAAQSNFDFFRFSGNCHEEKLKEKCEGVMRVAYTTVMNMCELGVRLKEIKESGEWHHVVDPETGDRFLYSNFAKFCKYAFGFSPTRTSNLLSLSAFALIKDGRIVFINEKYEDYMTSQLIEIAPVSSWERRFFDADMTVDEMRLVKKYMKSHEYKKIEGDINNSKDMLSAAISWERQEKIKKMRPKQLPGQIEMSTEVLEDTEKWACGNPTSDFCAVEVPQEEVDEPTSEPKDIVEEMVQVVAKAQERYEFSIREKARAFLAGYREWQQEDTQDPFIASYVHNFPDGAKLHAREEYVCKDLTTFEKKVAVRYFWEEDGRPEVSVGKTRVVNYLRMAKDGAR